MTRFALTIEYDGRPYMGWQRQAHGPSVQQAIEEAVHRLTAETVQVFSAGRTDAGVHAIAMRAHLDIEKPLTPFKLTEALNAQTALDVLQRLRARSAGRSLLIATHLRREAALADRLVTLRDGRIVGDARRGTAAFEAALAGLRND